VGPLILLSLTQVELTDRRIQRLLNYQVFRLIIFLGLESGECIFSPQVDDTRIKCNALQIVRELFDSFEISVDQEKTRHTILCQV